MNTSKIRKIEEAVDSGVEYEILDAFRKAWSVSPSAPQRAITVEQFNKKYPNCAVYRAIPAKPTEEIDEQK